MTKKTKLYYAMLLTMVSLTQVQASEDREDMGCFGCLPRCVRNLFTETSEIGRDAHIAPPAFPNTNFPCDILNYAYDNKKSVSVRYKGGFFQKAIPVSPVLTGDNSISMGLAIGDTIYQIRLDAILAVNL